MFHLRPHSLFFAFLKCSGQMLGNINYVQATLFKSQPPDTCLIRHAYTSAKFCRNLRVIANTEHLKLKSKQVQNHPLSLLNLIGYTYKGLNSEVELRKQANTKLSFLAAPSQNMRASNIHDAHFWLEAASLAFFWSMVRLLQWRRLHRQWFPNE